MRNYFKSSNQIFIFDETKHIKEILFHHYIMKKVLASIEDVNLDNGKFLLCNAAVARELNMTRRTITRIINTFIELNIIEVERKEKGRNMYQYVEYLKEKE